MIYDTQNINVSMLEQYLSLLNKEKENFNNVSYDIFKNSYMNNISDIFIKNVVSNIEVLYKEIEHDYNNIIKWFNTYLNNIKSLELYLSDDSSLGSISESELRNFIDYKLPKLDIHYKK